MSDVDMEPAVQPRYPQGFWDSLTQPCAQPKALLRLTLCSTLRMVPGLSMVFLHGYKMEVMKRVARQEDEILPDPVDLKPIVMEGIRMALISFVFYLIPIIGLWLADLGILQHFLNLGDIFDADSYDEFIDNIWEWLKGLALRVLLFVIWDLLMDPVLMSAKMHYARYGRFQTFLNIPYHCFAAIRDIGFHLKAMLFSTLFWSAVIVIELVLSLTIVGAFLFPLVVASAYTIATGYEYGARAQTL